MDIFNDLICQLTALGPETLVVLISISLGYVLRLVPQFPNKLIPMACILLGAVLYPLIGPAPKADAAVRHPVVHQVLLGFLLGFLSWIGHNKFLKPLEERVPWLKGLLDDPGSGSSSGFIDGRVMGILGVSGFMALALAGCGHATLEAGGAYAPVDTNGLATIEADYDLFLVDSTYGLAHDAIGEVFKFERTNRLMLWRISPAIKRGLDQVRVQAKTVDLQFAVARTAYLANPVPANLSTLQQMLAKAQQLTAAAQAVLANQGAANAPPTGTNALPKTVDAGAAPAAK